MRSFSLLLRFFVDDLFAVVVTAILANAVREIVFAAVLALNHAGQYQFPNVGTSLISARFGCFSLRNCHPKHLLMGLIDILTHYGLLYTNQSCFSSSFCKIASLGSISFFAEQPQSPSASRFPHFGHSPGQSSRHR